MIAKILYSVTNELILLVLALLLAFGFVTYIGTTPMERYQCETQNETTVGVATCIFDTIF